MIANTEIGLDPNNSVIKRLWCTKLGIDMPVIVAHLIVYLTGDMILIEPHCEKTILRGFRPGPTQTRLYSYRRWLEA